MQFKRIGRQEKELIESYISNWNIDNADYLFTTLYLWGRHGKITYAEQDGALFLLYRFPGIEPFFTCPIPKDNECDYKKYIDIAFDHLRSMGVKRPTLRSVSPPFSELISKSAPELTFERTRNADDYIYTAESLRTLSGKKLHSKKNHLNRFLAQNENWSYEKLSPDMLSECMSLYDEWQEHKEEDLLTELDETDEKLTVELAVKYMDDLGLFGGAIRINGRIEAFSVGERYKDSDLAIVHIEKANADISGLYAHINNQFVLNELGFANEVNREDDMGLMGLRKAKLSYRPVRMVEKYMVYEQNKTT